MVAAFAIHRKNFHFFWDFAKKPEIFFSSERFIRRIPRDGHPVWLYDALRSSFSASSIFRSYKQYFRDALGRNKVFKALPQAGTTSHQRYWSLGPDSRHPSTYFRHHKRETTLIKCKRCCSCRIAYFYL